MIYNVQAGYLGIRMRDKCFVSSRQNACMRDLETLETEWQLGSKPFEITCAKIPVYSIHVFYTCSHKHTDTCHAFIQRA